MLTLKTSIIASLLSAFTLGVAFGQTSPVGSRRLRPVENLPTPTAPQLPPTSLIDDFVADVPPATPVAPEVAATVAPKVATPAGSKNGSAAGSHAIETPNQRQLVSILKRNLPQSNQTIEMRDAPEWFQTLMQRIVRENVPDKYVRDKDWGKTDKRWDGLAVRRKGPLNLTTKRKWKEVHHGTWKRYEITQRNPNENLLLKIENVHDAGKGKVGFEVELASKVHAHGRFAKWAKGVQMYNLSADADAAVVMRLWCDVGMKLDIAKFPPDVLLVPNVTKARMQLTDFQLQSVSKLDGPLVKKLSGSVHKVLLDKIEEKRDKLPQKINKQIAKNKDKMRLSMSDFAASKWKTLASSSTDDSKTESKTESRTADRPNTARNSSSNVKPNAAKRAAELQLNSATQAPPSVGSSEHKLIDLLGSDNRDFR